MTELRCDDREVCLLIVDDNCIKDLNYRYLKRNCPTNIISFPMTEGEFGSINPQILGDIIISVETASRAALTENIDLMDEVEFLLIHGLLHLLGYDHENTSPERAKEMHDLEKKLFFLLRNYYLDSE